MIGDIKYSDLFPLNNFACLILVLILSAFVLCLKLNALEGFEKENHLLQSVKSVLV